jgi:type IV pilus assembly protein PilE
VLATEGNSMTQRAYATRSGGFSLVELMVVVAVLGILAAIAVPSYQDYVLRSKLVDALSSLAQQRVSMEQYYQDNRSFDSTPAAATGNCGIALPASSYFTYACATANAGQEFTITATGSAASTAAFAYTVDQGNNRRTTALATGWGSAPAECWINSKGQTC